MGRTLIVCKQLTIGKWEENMEGVKLYPQMKT